MNMTHFITLPDRRSVTVAEYLRSWKQLLQMRSDAEVKGWTWYPISAGDVLRDIREGIHDRINTRGQIPQFKPITEARLRRKQDQAVFRKRLICECRWCGQPLASYAPQDQRFCSSSCKRACYH